MTQEAPPTPPIDAVLGKVHNGTPLTDADRQTLAVYDQTLKTEADKLPPQEKSALQTLNPDSPDLSAFIQRAKRPELSYLKDKGVITEEAYQAELARREPEKNASGDQQQRAAPGRLSEFLEKLLERATGVEIGEGTMSMTEAQQWVQENVPSNHQSGLKKELEFLRRSGREYNISISRNWRGAYKIFGFRQPQPWDRTKKDAAQSVTREVRRETGKQLSHLINPDYSHNEIMNQYKLVREALPQGSATRQALDKVDSAVKILLTASGITAEAANLLINAIRGALLEAPELKYKVAALLPDDVVRQGYVVGARNLGNTLRRYIHDKYHLPDRPKQTPILVNRLDQIKPEHYRQQDAQKVGVDMRDLSREKAHEFILKNVPLEKQASALETIDRLPGNTFGVQIMDAGWVRISASAREPRWTGSYDARKNPQ